MSFTQHRHVVCFLSVHLLTCWSEQDREKIVTFGDLFLLLGADKKRRRGGRNQCVTPRNGSGVQNHTRLTIYTYFSFRFPDILVGYIHTMPSSLKMTILIKRASREIQFLLWGHSTGNFPNIDFAPPESDHL